MSARPITMAIGLWWLETIVPVPARAQSVEELVAEARALGPTRPGDALSALRQAVALDSLNYEASWRIAVAQVEVVQATADSLGNERRDSLYLEAERHARRAIRIDSSRVDGYFALGMSLGRIALTKGKRERIRYAREIHEVSTKAVTLDPGHDGVHHILGLWHAEAMRTSGLNRFLAKNLLGGKILSQASWSKAIEHLETAVRLDPDRIYHRLDLARVYADRKRFVAAREQLDAVERLPNREARDPTYRQEGVNLLERIAGKVDKTGQEL